MRRRYKFLIVTLIIFVIAGLAIWYFSSVNIAVLDPKGPIARQERNLIYVALALSLIVVVPVFTAAGFFAWRYREGNTKAKYSPDLDGNRIVETIWWLIPSAIILVLAIVAWNSSHTLDPYRPISSNNKPLTIQVVALDWKWLFIYPQQDIASVNFFQFPANTPLNFEVTSDTVMNSFWIPQLGGQIYAMPGMSTQLHLLASSKGSFNGSSANISGDGFSGMTFVARSTSNADFNSWVSSVKHSHLPLDTPQYSELSLPSENNQPAVYSSAQKSLYDTIVDKYMVPGATNVGMGL